LYRCAGKEVVFILCAKQPFRVQMFGNTVFPDKKFIFPGAGGPKSFIVKFKVFFLNTSPVFA
jgi:hypothetical protein